MYTQQALAQVSGSGGQQPGHLRWQRTGARGGGRPRGWIWQFGDSRVAAPTTLKAGHQVQEGHYPEP